MSNNVNKDPNQWLPPSQKPDILCTILELWSRHHAEIAKYRNFQSTNTIADYTGMLFVISPALSTKPVSRMTAPDVGLLQNRCGRGRQKPVYARTILITR